MFFTKIKKIVKRYASADLWKKWSLKKQNASALFKAARYLAKNQLSWTLLNVGKILLKENLHIYGILDYPDYNIRMAIDTRHQIWRLRACKKEPETVEWIKSSIRPGDVFYDVGANVGAYSFVAYAATGKKCRVFAFEPGFSTFEALVRNIYLNNFADGVAPYQIAFGERTGSFIFHYSGIDPGMASHFLSEQARAEPDFRPAYSQPILCFRLDDFIRTFETPPPTLMKIDVDGGELGVIRGAEKTLRHQNLRSILIEIDKRKSGFEEIIKRIEERDFRIYSEHRHTENIFNYVFVKK